MVMRCTLDLLFGRIRTGLYGARCSSADQSVGSDFEHKQTTGSKNKPGIRRDRNLTEGVEHFFRTLAEFLRGRTKLSFSCNDSKSDALRFGS